MTAKERVQQELSELSERLDNLTHFKATPAFDNLSPVQTALLNVQQYIMRSYKQVLSERLAYWVGE